MNLESGNINTDSCWERDLEQVVGVTWRGMSIIITKSIFKQLCHVANLALGNHKISIPLI